MFTQQKVYFLVCSSVLLFFAALNGGCSGFLECENSLPNSEHEKTVVESDCLEDLAIIIAYLTTIDEAITPIVKECELLDSEQEILTVFLTGTLEDRDLSDSEQRRKCLLQNAYDGDIIISFNFLSFSEIPANKVSIKKVFPNANFTFFADLSLWYLVISKTSSPHIKADCVIVSAISTKGDEITYVTDLFGGRRRVSVRASKAKVDWTQKVRILLEKIYPQTKKIKLVCDILNPV